MPTNKELTDDILALDPDAKVEGLTNPKLAALLKQLRAGGKTENTAIEPKPTLGVDLSAPKEDEPPLVTAEQQAEDKAALSTEPKAKLSEEIKTTIENTDAGLAVSLEKEDKFLDVTFPNLVDASAEAAEEPTKFYTVAEKRAITSKRGILGPGEEVRPEYFVNGEAVIADLLEKGVIK